ncbi:facilitated trehalose transporter Tret1 [Leptinotarsa decemlineata]|uniref:facilitated trehalose transporter Tret1 n=1 Tax=Leptinotarsa decemlineata TaxID=7539 RepID=UPI003D306B8F
MSYTYIVACAGNLISFSIGTSMTWTSPEIDKLKNDTSINMTDEEGSWVSSLLQLGAVFGPVLYGFLADAVGRRYSVFSLGIPIIVCNLLMAFVKCLPVFYISRFVIGLTVGGVFAVVPVYLAEIGDATNRGLLSSLLNVFLCCGMLFTYVLGPYVSILVFNLILAIFPTAFTVAFFFLAPETPTYLFKSGKSGMARQILQKLRGPRANIDEELSAIEQTLKEESSGSFLDIFRSKGTLKAFCMAVGLVTIQQFTGINAVLSYAQTIFEYAGSSLEPEISSIILGAVQLLSSFITPTLVDRFGRKILLLVSVAGLVIAEVPLGVYVYLKVHGTDLDSISFLPIICMIAFILFYTFGIGPLPWTVASELFPNNIKSKAVSLTSVICWVLAFLIVKFFQSVADSIGMGVSFLILAGICAVSIAFIQFFVIETGGKTFGQIQKELNG